MRNYRKSSNSSARRFHPKPCPYVQQPQIKPSKIAAEGSVWALLLFPEAHSRPKPPVHQEASTFPLVWSLLTRCVQLEHYVKNCIHMAIVLDVAKNVRLRACRHWSVPRSTTCWLHNHGSWQSPWHTPHSWVKEARMSSLTNLSWHMDVKYCYCNRLLKTYWKYSETDMQPQVHPGWKSCKWCVAQNSQWVPSSLWALSILYHSRHEEHTMSFLPTATISSFAWGAFQYWQPWHLRKLVMGRLT